MVQLRNTSICQRVNRLFSRAIAIFLVVLACRSAEG